MSQSSEILAQEWIVMQEPTATSPLPSLVEQDVERIQETTGRAVKVLETDWVAEMRSGVIVQVHIRRWRGKTRLDATDLGLDSGHTASLTDLMTLGEKMLMPKSIIKRLDALDSKVRSKIEHASFTTHWGNFVPVTAYSDLKTEIAELEAEYFAIRDEILSNYFTWVEQMRVEYRLAARAAYQRLLKVAPAAVAGQDEQTFVVRFVTSILSRIPSQSEIGDSFDFEVELFYIPLPSLLAEDRARAEGITVQTELDVDRMRAQRRLEREREYNEVETLRSQAMAARTSAEIKEQQMREMNRDIVEQARKAKEQLINGFMADVRTQFTGAIFNACTDVLAKLQDKDTMHPRSVVQLSKMTEQIGKLNFFGDEDAERMIERVRQTVLNVQSGDRNYEDVQKQLGAIVTLTRQTLVDLGDRPASVRALGLSDNPAPSALNMARRTLNLDVEIVEPDVMPVMERTLVYAPVEEVA